MLFFCSGIEVTLDHMPDNGVILVVTDAGSHQHKLEKSIRKKSLEKNVKITFAFSPSCRAQCRRSLPVYKRLSDGRMFNRSDFSSESFYKSVVQTVWNHWMVINVGEWSYISLNAFVTAQNINWRLTCRWCTLVHRADSPLQSIPTSRLQQRNQKVNPEQIWYLWNLPFIFGSPYKSFIALEVYWKFNVRVKGGLHRKMPF